MKWSCYPRLQDLQHLSVSLKESIYCLEKSTLMNYWYNDYHDNDDADDTNCDDDYNIIAVLTTNF